MTLAYTSVARCLVTVPKVGSVSTVTSADIVAFCEDAEALINAKLSKSYTVPVAGSPPLLAMLATDIALYRLLALRLFTQDQVNKSEWPEKFKDALDVLNDIAAGEIPLLTTSGDTVPATAAAGQVISDVLEYAPTMNELDVVEQQIDPDWIDKTRDEQG